VCFTIFLLQYSEAGAPSVRKSIMSRLMLVSWLSGSLLFLLVGVSLREVMDSVWILSFLPFTLYAFLRLCLKAWRTRTPSSVAMVMAILLAIGLAIHDYAAQQSLFGMSELYLLHLGIPAFLVVMGSVLLDRFIDSLHQAETSNEQLAERVAVRERELMHSHEQLRKLEREYATTEERQRIMQDMHDGVGSHLLSTLALVQRGNATAAHMETMLKECLDDMRLVIDASSPSEPDLLPVLGNLRFRMEARFRDLGLAFEWRNRDLPDSLEINPHAGLQVLRILQEALTNILKHARASRILVDLQFSAETLLVALEDDGVGFDEAMPASGYGLGNMRMRAGRIGADLHIAAQAHGTRLTLTVPLSGIVNVNLPASN
jgi:signal transduction histidine kinase